MSHPAATPAQHADSRDIWNENARFWAHHHGDAGNSFHRVLVAPVAERLLDLKPGDRILEVSCGSGLFARRMIDLGAAHIVAFDYSEIFVDEARKRNGGYDDRIEFLVLDATDEEAMLRELLPRKGEKGFDKAISNMALMDISNIAPLFRTLRTILNPGSQFTVTLMHPAFNSPTSILGIEQLSTPTGEFVIRPYIKMHDYLGSVPTTGVGISGQAKPHWYFPRSLHAIMNEGFRSGFVVDGFEEVAWEAREKREGMVSADWKDMPTFPPVVAMRFRIV